MCWEREYVLSHDHAAPSYARHVGEQALSAVLEGTSVALLADTAIVVSELVTNAINAGARSPILRLTMHRETLEISVTDDAPGYPHREQVPASATHGRGLQIVAALAREWGMTEQAGHAKRVWAHLAVDPSLTSGLSCNLDT